MWARLRHLLSHEEARLLRRLAAGWSLKSHRYLDGTKIYRCHGLAGEEEAVPPATVDRLARRGLIHTNHKFPAGTYLLTERGRQVAARLGSPASRPLGPRDYFSS